MPVPVGLDHHHHLGRPDVGLEGGDVGPEGRQVDLRPAVAERDQSGHHPVRAISSSMARSRRCISAMVSGRCSASCCGGTGPGCRRRGVRLHRGRPETGLLGPLPGGQQGSADAAEHVTRPGLPGPRRSRQGHPDRAASSGPGHQLAGALEQHGRPGLARPPARTARTGSSVTQERSSPSSLASSPACGVSSQLSGQRSGRKVSPSASTTVGSPESSAAAISSRPSTWSPQPEPSR